MADFFVDIERTRANDLMVVGVKAFVLQDFAAAVSAFSKASEQIVAEEKDDQHDSLGDVYLYYGRALLELSREEVEALGDLGKKLEDDNDDDEEEDGEEKQGNGDAANGTENGNAKPQEGIAVVESSEAASATSTAEETKVR